MDEETTQMLKEILLAKYALDLTLAEVGRVKYYPRLLAHIVQGLVTIEFEFKFRDTQEQYGTNLADATAKFAIKDTAITPEFTGVWKIV